MKFVFIFVAVIYAMLSVSVAVYLQHQSDRNTKEIVAKVEALQRDDAKTAEVIMEVKTTLTSVAKALQDTRTTIAATADTMKDQRQALIDAQKNLDDMSATLNSVAANVATELDTATEKQQTATVRVVRAAGNAEEAARLTRTTVRKALPTRQPNIIQRFFGGGVGTTNPNPTPKPHRSKP